MAGQLSPIFAKRPIYLVQTETKLDFPQSFPHYYQPDISMHAMMGLIFKNQEGISSKLRNTASPYFDHFNVTLHLNQKFPDEKSLQSELASYLFTPILQGNTSQFVVQTEMNLNFPRGLPYKYQPDLVMCINFAKMFKERIEIHQLYLRAWFNQNN